VRIVRVPPCRARLHAMRWILPVGARPWWIMLAPCLMPRLPLPQLGSLPILVPLADLHPRTRPTDEPPFSGTFLNLPPATISGIRIARSIAGRSIISGP
jgi:hypothetical protein